MHPLAVLNESHRIHNVVMFEVVRQVSAHCAERGSLLLGVWQYVWRAFVFDCGPPPTAAMSSFRTVAPLL
jgi:hypothetical protein